MYPLLIEKGGRVAREGGGGPMTPGSAPVPVSLPNPWENAGGKGEILGKVTLGRMGRGEGGVEGFGGARSGATKRPSR